MTTTITPKPRTKNATLEAQAAIALYIQAREGQELETAQNTFHTTVSSNLDLFRVTLNGEETKPLLEVRRNPDGTVHADPLNDHDGNEPVTVQLDLRNETATLQLGVTFAPEITGHCLNTIRRMLADQHHDPPENGADLDAVLETVAVTLADAHRQATRDHDHEDRAAQQALEDASPQLLDPTAVHTLIQQLRKTPNAGRTGQTTLTHHNALAANGLTLQTLSETNPGATVWALRRWQNCLPARPTNPAQLMRNVQRDMAQLGMDKRAVRAAVRPGTPLPDLLDQGLSPTEAAQAISIITARQLTVPDVPSLVACLRMAQNAYSTEFRLYTIDNQPWPHAAHSRNNILEALITKECRAQRTGNTHPWHRDRAHQIPDVLDWATATVRAGNTVPKAGWRTMLRECANWHRQLTRQKYQNEWQAILRSNSGHYLAWHSLLPETQTENALIIPLDDERKLFQESMAQDHCVINYGRHANAGDRLFSATLKGDQKFTTHIAHRTGQWNPIQTRGYRNAPPSPEMTQAASLIAHLYQEAWDRATTQEREEKAELVPDEESPQPNPALAAHALPG